jgi:hypothetical protein
MCRLLLVVLIGCIAAADGDRSGTIARPIRQASAALPHPTRSTATALKLAAAQVLTNDGDYQGNLHRISTAVAKAAAGGAELVAFPETSLDGWMLNAAITIAPPIPGNWSETIGRLAARHGM